MNISNFAAAKIERLTNGAVHGLVFANQHIQDDQLDEALDTLASARLNIDAISELLEKAKRKNQPKEVKP